jgi:Fe-S cluster assembly protein SufB
MSISEAIKEHPELVQTFRNNRASKDNYYALNSAVFSDGSFVISQKAFVAQWNFLPYFRINQAGTGQFERTLLVADEGVMCHT